MRRRASPVSVMPRRRSVAYFAHKYLVSRVDRVVATLETRTMEFMDLLNDPTA